MASLLKTKRVVWGIIFALVTAVAALSYSSGARYLAAARAVEHALAAQAGIDGMLSLLKDAETGHRGFILTGDEQFLAPYTGAEARQRRGRTANAPFAPARALGGRKARLHRRHGSTSPRR
jgi:CHASE3 domain sensor protein